MSYYVDCPACPKLRPGYERGLVVKGQKYCRMCQGIVLNKPKVRKKKLLRVKK